jgi:hypothetical protein
MDEKELDLEAVDSLPDTLPTEDVRGLKSTLQKLKKELAEMRMQAKLAERYRQALDNISPEEAERLKAELQSQKQLEEELLRVRSEVEQKIRSEYDQQLAATSAKLEAEAKARQELEKRVAIERVFNGSGGKGGEFDVFYTLIANRVEYDPESRQVTRVLDDSGKPMYHDGKPISLEEFMALARQGRCGSVLQAAFAPYNQATGAGVPSGTIGGDGVLYLRPNQLADFIKGDPLGAPEKIRKGIVKFIS